MKAVLQQKSRLQKIQSELFSDACLVEDESNLFYLTGLKLSRGTLLLTKKEAILYVDSRYKEMASKCSFLDVREMSIDITKSLGNLCKEKKIFFDSTQISHERFCQLKKLFPSSTLQTAPSLFAKIRSIKSKDEIVALQKSASLLWKGFCHVKTLLKTGVTEKKIAQELLLFCIERGATGWSFEPNVSFGKNSALPHHRASDAKLKQGDVVLIDVGIVYEGYASDMTRTVFFGKIDPKLSHLFDLTLLAYKQVLSLLSPGTPVGKLDEAARSFFKKEGVDDLFIHALGHGIGLEVHEFPRIKWNGEHQEVLLEEGMVLCIEPGLYLPGLGGIRYEDTVVITKKGYKNFYPKTPLTTNSDL